MRCRASKVSFLFVFADLVTNQISVCLEIGRWGEIGEQDYKGAQGNFGVIFLGRDGYEYAHDLDCCDSLTGLYMFQNFSNFTLLIMCLSVVQYFTVLYVSCFSKKLVLKSTKRQSRGTNKKIKMGKE